MECVICSNRIRSSESHNAEPITTGRCCSRCNVQFVLPARLSVVFNIPATEVWDVVSDSLADLEKMLTAPSIGNSQELNERRTQIEEGGGSIEEDLIQ
mgnify:CR=1 FL=1